LLFIVDAMLRCIELFEKTVSWMQN